MKYKSLAVMTVLVFLIFNIISISLFIIYMRQNGENKAVKYAQKSTLEMTIEKSELISIAFERIQGRVEMLARYMEEILETEVSEELSDDYVIREDGTITRLKNPEKDNSEQSNIIVPNTTVLSKELIREINLTEKLDKYFALVKENEDVSWCYIVTKDNLLRCSPYSELGEFFSSDHSQVNDVFYTQASNYNNPKNEAIWTTPYYDYLGTGWTMTCTKPIFEKNGELFGVICIDLPINKIKEKYLEELSLSDSGKICWMTADGDVYYHTDYQELRANQGEELKKNIFNEALSEEHSEKLRDVAGRSEPGMDMFYSYGIGYNIIYSPVRNTDSLLFVEINLEELSTFYDLDINGVLLIAFLDLILVILFATLLYFRFSKPMHRLVDSAKKISMGCYDSLDIEEANKEGYYEIVRLNQAFYSMSESIKKYTEDLKDKNSEIKTIIDAIDETLMVVEAGKDIDSISIDVNHIPTDLLKSGIAEVVSSKEAYEQTVVAGGEAYKNIYYPIIKENTVSKVVISSECVTKALLFEKEIQQIEKMAGVGQLAAAIVHELKNILARIKGATYILDMTASGERSEVITIKHAVDEAENVITTLLDFSARDEKGSEMIHIGTLINQILLLSKKEIIGKGISIYKDIDNACYVHSDKREAIKVILQNIIINSIQGVGNEGKIEIRCFQQKSEIVIFIKDNGPGIKEADRDKIFEPFFTTKEGGHGIGLWITKRLIDSLGGEIELNSPEDGGAEFKLTMPDNIEEEN